MTETELRGLVKEWVRQNSRDVSARGATIGDETDLLASGWLDSLGFVELLAWVEERTGIMVDLDGADPQTFTTVTGFCRMAVQSGKPVQ